mmetsp:Transcript_57823/g.187637  ORF Transcript_57823/g.187637 Transcript_57823/m.187637 type:complete len:106 (+) Transcript_57823:52-369(+)
MEATCSENYTVTSVDSSIDELANVSEEEELALTCSEVLFAALAERPGSEEELISACLVGRASLPRNLSRLAATSTVDSARPVHLGRNGAGNLPGLRLHDQLSMVQ